MTGGPAVVASKSTLATYLADSWLRSPSVPADIAQIDDFLQRELTRRRLDEVPAVEAAGWLDAAGLLTDSVHRPGLPLRNLLRAGSIASSEQRPPQKHGKWFIVRRRPGTTSF
jgi:hypothetical protein